MRQSIDNSQDVIDSRDVIDRIEELTDEREALETPAEQQKWDEGSDGEELKALKALADEAEGYCEDWKHGSALIRASHFVEYCEQLVEDLGGMPEDLPPYLVIDWDATADNLKVDYTEVDFDGVAYYVR